MSRRSVINGFFGGSVNEFTDVLIIAGQSNARGNTGGVSPVTPYIVPNPLAEIVGIDNSVPNEFASFGLLDYNTGNAMGTLNGLELSFAYEYGLKYPSKNLKIVKVVQGGTSLATDWANGSILRNKLIEYINYAKNNVINPRFTFYWNQWENDSISTPDSAAYKVNYQGLISEVLAATIITFNKHIIYDLNPNGSYYSNYITNCNTILQAQADNKILYDAASLNGNDLPLHDDIHYTSEAYNVLGQRLIDLF